MEPNARDLSAAGLPKGPAWAVLDEAVAAFASRPCIDFLGKRWTYAEIGDLVERAAKGFQDLGVGPGVRVGLCLPNTPYAIVAFFGVLKAGGTVVNYNPLYVERELANQIEDSGTSIMVTMDLALIYPKVAGLLGRTSLKTIVVCPMAAVLPFPKRQLFPILRRKELAAIPDDARHVKWDRLLAAKGARPVTVDPDRDVAVLQYTGGTTGVPKGAMLTHGNLSAQLEQMRRVIPKAEPGYEKLLCVLPLFHVFAMSVGMFLGLKLGAELILLPRFELAQVIDVVARKRPTLFPGVPTLYAAINTAMENAPVDLTSLKYCISGGAPLPAEILKAFEARSGCRLVEGYGLTECSPVVAVNPLDAPGKAGSIGKPVPGTTIEIRSPDDGSLVPEGEKGELCILGPQVMAGYWNRPEETKAVFRGPALRTGDVGYRDPDGFIFIVDRIKDLILCSGFNVYPRVIEEALYQHPAVSEAVAIGVPDPYRGQAPKAFVTLRADASARPEDLMAFLAGYLSRIEMPKEIEIRDTLPKTMIGKLSKKELVAEEAAKAGQGAQARQGETA
ncbi:long-chain-fatty-acid--CoA ligase [Prosthecomicrobium sp. N25]|uniref:long-chain-fatty-acid--CoA ligase n=1 Tax=Prosthecomicrobium sp. N25 TaxID=3129254 RepID=UPI003077E010